MLSRLRLLVATLWVGSGWTIGYLVAPTLFATLPDPLQAGRIAGSLFRLEAWLSIACAIVLLALSAASRQRDGGAGYRSQMTLVALMLVCTLIGYFGLQPLMEGLRETASASGLMSEAIRTRFAMLHGIAGVLYLFQSVLGIALIWRIR
ncbi:MAG TPA: DUF4149 domain-containing protein [Burkholderiaceae bacterium]|nr:DUF4149 domain-containing protein [Burkholderiaceae bacterium]